MPFKMPLHDFIDKLVERKAGNTELSEEDAEDYDDPFEAIELEEKGVMRSY